MARLYIVGLTGGIASGKSAVSRVLRELGAPVVDADRAAREVAAEAVPELVEAFGEGVRRPDGSLDRRRLADLVFADPEARRRLEAVIHPRVLLRLRRQLQELEREGTAVAVLEVPLLVEAGLVSLVDEMWVVAADPERQIARLAERDGLTREQALRRLGAQLPLADKLKAAHVVIDNDGTPAETRRQVAARWARLTGGERPRGEAFTRWRTEEGRAGR